MKLRLALAVVLLFVLVAVLAYMADQPKEEKEADVETHIYQFLIDEGFTPVQTSGIMAEIRLNSNFDSTAISIDEQCYGLLQWVSFRRDNLEQFADEIGKPIDDVDTQLLFLVEEVNPESKYYALYPIHGYEWTDFLDATNPKQAVEAFCMVYTRHYKADLEQRGIIAEQFWELYNSVN